MQNQCRICPQCHDDHGIEKECSPRFSNELSNFMPPDSDKSFIANAYRERVKERDQLKAELERVTGNKCGLCTSEKKCGFEMCPNDTVLAGEYNRLRAENQVLLKRLRGLVDSKIVSGMSAAIRDYAIRNDEECPYRLAREALTRADEIRKGEKK